MVSPLVGKREMENTKGEIEKGGKEKGHLVLPLAASRSDSVFSP